MCILKSLLKMEGTTEKLKQALDFYYFLALCSYFNILSSPPSCSHCHINLLSPYYLQKFILLCKFTILSLFFYFASWLRNHINWCRILSKVFKNKLPYSFSFLFYFILWWQIIMWKFLNIKFFQVNFYYIELKYEIQNKSGSPLRSKLLVWIISFEGKEQGS